MSYILNIHPKALKEIQRLSSQDIKRVEKKIDALTTNPRPNGYIKMTNYESERVSSDEFYRIKIGDNRITYIIEDKIITITIVQVKKRGDIY